MANQGNQTTTVMYRCGIPTAGGVRFSVFLRNYHVNWIPETTLDFTALGGNQQFRADIVSRDGMLDDPFTTSAQHILMNHYQTQPPDPLDSTFYFSVTDDISAFIGESVCLRFATVAGESFLVAGIDDVIFQAKDLKDDTDSDILQNDIDADDDGDRCSDAREFNGTVGSQYSGGLRDPHNFWDFYDVPTGGGLVRDGAVSALDIFAVLGRFATVGSPAIDPLSVPPPNGYHTAYDRGVVLGPNVWNLGPANGSIASTDLFGVLGQFTHSCV